jgi:hypothetical protein
MAAQMCGRVQARTSATVHGARLALQYLLRACTSNVLPSCFICMPAVHEPCRWLSRLACCPETKAAALLRPPDVYVAVGAAAQVVCV